MNVKTLREKLKVWGNKDAEIRLHDKYGEKLCMVIADKSCVSLQSGIENRFIPMTLGELENTLEKENPDSIVTLDKLDGEEVLFILGTVSMSNIIWLETESDCNMTNELSYRFKDAVENGIDELDVYEDLLNTGISIDMVRECLGDEAANHMEEFCKEHGLI